ncbi:DEAD/DEAH box helicase [[Clostridium] polysaccharolyticum]|uniref:DEAD/DEAH box helicase n=1 Tax=[Clostridium] polysaccharolyticum TaxID=29364 RepID=UPI000B874513|nr:ATP-binding domain-containing protein [[Clostridium] polysaccharolyticum]
MLNIIRGVSSKIEVAENVIKILKQVVEEGYVYIGYPVLGSFEGKLKVDVMLVSRAHGLVIFDIEMGNQEYNKEEEQDILYNNMESRLKRYHSLVERRKLKVDINIITFAPRWKEASEFVCTNDQQLRQCIENISWESPEYYYKLLESIQLISQIKKRGGRTYVQREDSKGGKLRKIEDQISCLDKSQSSAVIETVEDVQRIRGLAGSGKTIVLALKVAYLYTVYDNKVIAVTFNSRSLKQQFKELVTNFVIENTNEEPDWSRIKIIHAWGSSYSEGIYYDFCKKNNLKYYDYNEAAQKFGRNNAFHAVCKEAFCSVEDPVKLYDVILVDEAQDLSDYFLQMCYKSLPKDKKMLIYAYDELQSLDGNNLESPEVIFGETNGRPNVVLDNVDGKYQDLVLSKCYRNSKPILTTAHALGFGIYRKECGDETKLVQLFEDVRLWEDIGYKVEEGVLSADQDVVLTRTEESSPKFLEEHSDIDDLIIFKKFSDVKQESQWIADDIVKNIKEDELRYKDIMIIHPRPLGMKEYVSDIRILLLNKGIKSHIVGLNTSPDNFFQDDSIAISQIYRAKGNEAAMVYLVNADLCFDGINLASKRNIIFTAMTRSKGWVRVTGVGEKMKGLIEEYEKVKNAGFKLSFKYPNENELKKMRIIHRDKTRSEIQSISDSNANIGEFLKKLENEEIRLEDIDPAILQALREVIK